MKIQILDNSASSISFTLGGNLYSICKEQNELTTNGPHNGLSMDVEQDFDAETTTYVFADFKIVTSGFDAVIVKSDGIPVGLKLALEIQRSDILADIISGEGRKSETEDLVFQEYDLFDEYLKAANIKHGDCAFINDARDYQRETVNLADDVVALTRED